MMLYFLHWFGNRINAWVRVVIQWTWIFEWSNFNLLTGMVSSSIFLLKEGCDVFLWFYRWEDVKKKSWAAQKLLYFITSQRTLYFFLSLSRCGRYSQPRWNLRPWNFSVGIWLVHKEMVLSYNERQVLDFGDSRRNSSFSR